MKNLVISTSYFGNKIDKTIKQVIIKTDIENSVILIRPLEGLFDEN